MGDFAMTKLFATMCVASILAVGILCPGATRAFAAEEDQQLLKALPESKHTLAEGIEQAAKAPEVAISAKFEVEDGKLSLSVYTAEKGPTAPAEGNVLKELAGSPLAAKWTPEVEIFKDVEHVSRSAEQLTLIALSQASLLDIVKKAQIDQPGTVFSITPVLRNRSPLFVALVAAGGKAVELDYNLKGERVSPAAK
jgi:hypothetical protein